MAREVFVDTGAWVALADRDDDHHGAAKAEYPRLLSSYRLVTTNLVISETYTLLCRGLGITAALRFLSLLRSSPRIEVVYSTLELERSAETILKKYGDQQFSYTDAVSFALMRDRNMTHAFTFDRHFHVAGFQVIPSL